MSNELATLFSEMETQSENLKDILLLIEQPDDIKKDIYNNISNSLDQLDCLVSDFERELDEKEECLEILNFIQEQTIVQQREIDYLTSCVPPYLQQDNNIPQFNQEEKCEEEEEEEERQPLMDLGTNNTNNNAISLDFISQDDLKSVPKVRKSLQKSMVDDFINLKSLCYYIVYKRSIEHFPNQHSSWRDPRFVCQELQGSLDRFI